MATTSPVDICNLALSLLNVSPIVSIDTPENQTAELCALWYDQVRREALRRHPWNFAIKRAVLAANATAPAFGYQSAFDLPSDYIRLTQLNETDGYNDMAVKPDRYRIEDNQVLIGQYSTSSGTSLRLVYVSDFTSVAKMDASFIDYFVTLLGQKFAYSITQSNSTVERLDALMEKAESRARSMDGQENPPRRIQRSNARRARRNVSGYRNYDGFVVFD